MTTSTRPTTTPQPRTGAILLRVSTAQQADEEKTSYDVQRDDCLRAAAARGYVVPDDAEHRFQEVGKRDQYYTREGLQKAIEAAQQNRYQALFVWRLDRLTDDTEYFDRILKIFDQHGIELWSATEPHIDCRTEMGRNIAKMLIMFQIRPERGVTAQRTKQARRQYTEQGRAWASISPPYGYRWVVDPSRTVKRSGVVVPLKERFEPDPETAPAIVLIFAWVDAGRSLDWVARALSGRTEGGIYKHPTPRQYAHIAGANPDGEWCAQTVVKLLHNPAYKGHYAAYRTKRTKRSDDSEKHMQQRIPDDQWYYVEPSPSPALVDAGQWQRAQQRLQQNKLYAARNTRHPITPAQALVARGMARCGECGARMDLKVVRTGRAPTTVTDPRRYRYVCSASEGHAPKCPGVGWLAKAEDVDAAVWATLVEFCSVPQALTALAHASQEHDRAQANAQANATTTLITPLDTLRALHKRLADKELALLRDTERSEHLSATDPADAALLGYEMRMRTLGAEVLTLREDVVRAERDAANYVRTEQTIGEWEEYLARWREDMDLWASDLMPAEWKRGLLEDFGVRVRIHRRPDADNDQPGIATPLATMELHLTTSVRGATVPTGQGAAYGRPDPAAPPLELPVVPATPRIAKRSLR